MVTTKKFSRVAAVLLALVMLLTVVPFQGFAATVPATDLNLKDGVTVAISSDMDEDQVKKALFDALVENPEGANYQDYEWEYECEGKWAASWGNKSWGSVNGFTSKNVLTYNHPALKDNQDDTWPVRLAGGDQEVTITKVSSASATYSFDALAGQVFVDGQAVNNGTVNGLSPVKALNLTVKPNAGYEVAAVKVNGAEVEAVDGVYSFVPVSSTNVEVTFTQTGDFATLTVEAGAGVTVKLDGKVINGSVQVLKGQSYELTYTPDANTSVKGVKLNGTAAENVTYLNYVGTQFVSFDADTTLTVETINVNDQLVLTDKRDAVVAVNADGTFNFDGIRANFIAALVDAEKSIPVTFTKDNVVFEQEAFYYSAGDVQGVSKQWVSLEGKETGPIAGSYYHPIAIGNNHLRIRFVGNDQFRPTDFVEFDLDLRDIQTSSIAVKDAPVAVSESKPGVVDRTDIEKKVFDTIVDTENSIPKGLTFDDVEITVPEISTSGKYPVTFTFKGTTEYYTSTKTVDVYFDVKTVPQAKISLKTNLVDADLVETAVGVYDEESLKRDVFDKAVDTANSIPANLTYEDVKITFEGDVTAGGKVKAIIAYADTDEMAGTSVDVTVNVNVVSCPKVTLEQTAKDVVLNKTKDGGYDYDGLKQAIFASLKVTGVEGLKWNDFNYEYDITDGMLIHYRKPFETTPASVGDAGETLYNYLHEEGTFKIYVSISDSSAFYGTDVEFDFNVKVEDPFATNIVLKKDYPTDFTLYFDSNGVYDYDRLKKEIFEAVVDTDKSTPSGLSWDSFEYAYDSFGGVDEVFMPFETRGTDLGDPEETSRIYLHKSYWASEKDTKTIRITVAATDEYNSSSVKFDVKVNTYGRLASNIRFNDGKGEIPYTSDTAAIKEYIVNEYINYNTSKLPADVTVDDFTFEYWARNFTAGDFDGVEWQWSPFEGKPHPTLAGSYFKQIGAGTHKIRVRFEGSDTYLPFTAETTFTLGKADVNISLKQNYKYVDADLPSDFVRTDVSDSFEHYYFALDASDSTAVIYLDSLSGIDLLDFTGNVEFSWWLTQILGTGFTADEIYNRSGLSRENLVKLLKDQRMIDYCWDVYSIDANALSAMLEVINSVPEHVTKFSFKVGQPTKAGTYTMFAMATNEHYNTGFANSVFYVKYNSRGTKLIFVQNTDGLNSFNVKNFDYSAIVTKDGMPIESGHVKYIYTGFRSNALFYGSTKEGPRTPGIYTQTAWTGIGGKYAFPKTRTFTVSLF